MSGSSVADVDVRIGTVNTSQPPLSDPQHNPGYNQLSDLEKQQSAWQYHGYPSLSRWMASSNDFFILRKFSTLSARSLLYLQNEIAQREKKLSEWDMYSMKMRSGEGDWNTGSFKHDQTHERDRVLREIFPLLEKYYNLINSYSEVRSRPTAHNHHRRNLQSWFSWHPNAIEDVEQHFLDSKHSSDLFPIVSKPKTPLTTVLEKIRIVRFRFKPKHRTDHFPSPSTRYHSDTGLAIFTSIVIVVVGLMLLFAPVWWLSFVNTTLPRLGIITGFVSVFAAWLWIAAGPRALEILAGTAAYAAVLMAYLQVQR